MFCDRVCGVEQAEDPEGNPHGNTGRSWAMNFETWWSFCCLQLLTSINYCIYKGWERCMLCICDSIFTFVCFPSLADDEWYVWIYIYIYIKWIKYMYACMYMCINIYIIRDYPYAICTTKKSCPFLARRPWVHWLGFGLGSNDVRQLVEIHLPGWLDRCLTVETAHLVTPIRFILKSPKKFT